SRSLAPETFSFIASSLPKNIQSNPHILTSWLVKESKMLHSRAWCGILPNIKAQQRWWAEVGSGAVSLMERTPC
ncbi:MAG: hypothetical protein ABIF19_21305, partial [Planctomycetota bacterium]